MNRPQGLGWGPGTSEEAREAEAPSSLPHSFLCSAIETFPTSCLSSPSLLWGPFPTCLAHISAPLSPGCIEPGPLASPSLHGGLETSSRVLSRSALHVATFPVSFHSELQLPSRKQLSPPRPHLWHRATHPSLSGIPSLFSYSPQLRGPTGLLAPSG